MTNLKFNEKWWAQLEFHDRHTLDNFEQKVIATRIHVHRIVGKVWDFSAGMALFNQIDHDPVYWQALVTPELRPHVEAIFKHGYKILKFDHRFRDEGRFFLIHDNQLTQTPEHFEFTSIRFRYRPQLTISLSKPQAHNQFKIRINDEFMVNYSLSKNALKTDQNRIYLGISLEPSKFIGLELGYLNIQRQLNGGAWEFSHVVRITCTQNFKIRGSKK